MKVYQLKIKKADFIIEPVFKDRLTADLYKSKYTSRKFEIIECDLNNQDNYVYRIERIDDNEVYLDDELFDSLESANAAKNSNMDKIFKESILNNYNQKYEMIEV